MKGFIEVHQKIDDYPRRLINVNHIVDVWGNCIYIDSCSMNTTDFVHIECIESYSEIKDLIAKAVEC